MAYPWCPRGAGAVEASEGRAQNRVQQHLQTFVLRDFLCVYGAFAHGEATAAVGWSELLWFGRESACARV